MNYRYTAIAELKEVIRENPEMTFGELLYTITREKVTGAKTPSDYIGVTDEKWYNIIDKVRKDERED